MVCVVEVLVSYNLKNNLLFELNVAWNWRIRFKQYMVKLRR
jgi:hypothetical protein